MWGLVAPCFVNQGNLWMADAPIYILDWRVIVICFLAFLAYCPLPCSFQGFVEQCLSMITYHCQYTIRSTQVMEAGWEWSIQHCPIEWMVYILLCFNWAHWSFQSRQQLIFFYNVKMIWELDGCKPSIFNWKRRMAIWLVWSYSITSILYTLLILIWFLSYN